MIKSLIKWGWGMSERYVVIRYIISGGSSAVTDLGILYVLYHYFNVHYLLAAVFAYLFAFGISFTLHKYWTFKSHEEETHKQVMVYFVVSMLGLGLNTLFMYIFVDLAHLLVMVAQIVTGGLVALCTFFISRNFVFKYKEKK